MEQYDANSPCTGRLAAHIMRMLVVIGIGLAGVALMACAGLAPAPPAPRPAPAAPPASAVPGAEDHPLVVSGALTGEGQRKRDAGLHLVARDRNTEAFDEWLPLALAGHAESQYQIGMMTRQGLGAPVDHAAALDWLRLAAGGGFPPALTELGLCYQAGACGVVRDASEALRLFLRGASLDEPRSALHAGAMLAYGVAGGGKTQDGIASGAGSDINPGTGSGLESGLESDINPAIEQDSARGIDLLMQAAQAETPLAAAQSLLGRLYLGVAGIPVDYVQALYWFDLAAAADDSEAQFQIGEMWRRGRGVAGNPRRALEWYQRAAQQSHAGALNSIGLLYAQGAGVARDRQLARLHFEKAIARGSMDAALNLGDLLLAAGPGLRERDKAAALYRMAALANDARAFCPYARLLLTSAVDTDAMAEAQRWQDKARQVGIACLAPG